ncbi:hypothetical protein, variant [Puccinia graminis f. sp. tritici CRL 75-36-700-3]|uniref:Uncharacterized protein n=1 Tax=Puccinia graminis f. sp. tritici (strain CRL 75-36-700-3 / race SCCL) TaxID=418459 RepID=E3KSJ7_PUCGT|nr:uncharacterized protein PGTG_12867 [Puccinia graminis f. sp. tritici CRL 75-36-700-3]XP_003889323.1 hypothetical protein, variant [Puccinia graminis f. sp. tritici CRL 75-36-700-3]EFP87283.1 hypothetical protein PGTG_12867 [Puccinia graminis f. sp. tritici CRL 75-36-700-3]EHS64001.1 hypothetical protein, variant [Puccinia graminis f. sp. tritici CRL 75-36-700-3]
MQTKSNNSVAFRRICHPATLHGPFDIIASLGQIGGGDTTYGQFQYDTTIGFTDPTRGEEINIMIKANCYGSAPTALQADKVYVLHGRLVARNEDAPPILFCEQDVTLNIGDSSTYMSALANKVVIEGFGIVVKREEVPGFGVGNVAQTNLHVVLRHTDYDNMSRSKVEFEILYIVPGNKILGKTFGLFRLGRETAISGYISGYIPKDKMWEVKVTAVAPTSGDQAATVVVPQRGARSGNTHRRPGLIQLGTEQNNPTPTEQPANNGSLADAANVSNYQSPAGAGPSGSGTLPVIPEYEDGEVTEAAPEPQFVNTFQKRQTSKGMIADAKKRMKGL